MKALYVKVGPKSFAAILLAVAFVCGIVKVYVGVDLAPAADAAAHKVFIVETASDTTVVSATEVK